MESLRVLLVGSDERRAAVAAALRGAGFRVVETSDGREAADALHAATADMAVIDLLLPGLDPSALGAALTPDPLPPESLEMIELRHIRRTLAHTRGNRRQAAILLGISRSTLLHKIRKYGL
ncbi:MAG: helix-turn-helix domain-containing protein [Gemmatimonadota bacterium]